MEHLSVAAARPALVSGSSYCWACVRPPLLPCCLPMNWCRSILLDISPSSQIDHQMQCSNFCPLGNFPLTLSFRAVPEWGYIAAHFGVVPACPAALYVNQVWVFPSSVSWSQGTPHEPSMSFEKQKTMNQGIWATSSCKLLVPSGPARAQPWINHFHGVLLFTPGIMACWIRQHTDIDE